MWSSEAAIRDEVLKTFVDFFITDGSGELLPDNDIAKNLLVLTGQATVSELASIEEAIIRLIKDERIPANVFLILWSIASQGPAEARAAAIKLEGAAISANPRILALRGIEKWNGTVPRFVSGSQTGIVPFLNMDKLSGSKTAVKQ